MDSVSSVFRCSWMMIIMIWNVWICPSQTIIQNYTESLFYQMFSLKTTELFFCLSFTFLEKLSSMFFSSSVIVLRSNTFQQEHYIVITLTFWELNQGFSSIRNDDDAVDKIYHTLIIFNAYLPGIFLFVAKLPKKKNPDDKVDDDACSSSIVALFDPAVKDIGLFTQSHTHIHSFTLRRYIGQN